LNKNNKVLNNQETQSNIILKEPKTLEVTDSLEQVGNLERIDDNIDIFNNNNNEINTTLNSYNFK